MTTTAVRRRLGPVLLLMIATVGLAAWPAVADDEQAAWAATPSDAAGVPDGRTRFEVVADPGQTVEEHVLITNSSTVEREFAVYGADAFNTPDGGYDLLAAAEVSTDVGSWVSVGSPTITIPALSTAVVPLTVAVPGDAVPGDHAGGIVVSPVRTRTTDEGVVVDTRIAVRLSVRVAGELAPALEVRSVNGSFATTLVPFGSSDTTVTYEVVNTGNVMVVGVPRVRLTGPFGITMAEVEPDDTRQVLPGESFTVTTEIAGVAPLVLVTATVDVEMAAAPGPDTEIPLVSSTARATFPAIPWTGLVLVLLLAAGIRYLVRWLRWRRRAAAQTWDAMVAEAAALKEQEVRESNGSSRAGATNAGAMLLLTLVLAGGAALLPASPSAAAVDDEGAVTLTVPARPAPTVAAPTIPRRPRVSTPSPSPSPTVSPIPTEEPDEPEVVAMEVLPDLLWGPERGITPLSWALIALAAGAAATAGTLSVRLVRRRAAAGMPS